MTKLFYPKRKIKKRIMLKKMKLKTKQPQQKKIKKRYVIASISVIFHIFGAFWVLYNLVFDIERWLETMNISRVFFGYGEHQHKQLVILKIWMIAIQIRYILTDCWAFFNAITNRLLLEFTIKMHMLEGLICSVVFFIHNSDDCFVFGIVCVLWTVMWTIALLFILFGKNVNL